MNKDEEVYLTVGWDSLEEIFNGKTLDKIKSKLSSIDNETKEQLIIDLVELAVNLQQTNRKNQYILEPLLTGQVECRYRQ